MQLKDTAMKTKTQAFCLLVMSGLSFASQAGGLYLYEIGTNDLGLAAAGTAARAEDASTIFGNPAGMTRLTGDQFTVGAQALYGKVDYKVDNDALLAGQGGDPGNIIGWLPGGSAFYSHSVSDNLKVGVGAYGNFGLALDYGNSWAGRNLIDKTVLMAMTIQPTVAYRLNDQWSVGAGMTANYGYFKLQRDRLDGSSANLIDHDWAYGERLSVMFEPSDKTRVGLVWTSEVEYKFNIDGEATIDLGPLGITRSIPISSSVKAPQQMMASVYHRLDGTWAMMGNIGWQDWSEFANSTVEVGNQGSSTTSLQLEDTWHAALGVQYALDAQTKLNGGVAYDTSMYKSQSQTSFVLPAGDTWRLGVGMQYALSSQSDLGVAAEYVHIDDSSSPSRLVGGHFDNPQMFFMNVNYTKRF
jgi:long-chain fatty acid transport protein